MQVVCGGRESNQESFGWESTTLVSTLGHSKVELGSEFIVLVLLCLACSPFLICFVDECGGS